MIYLLLPTLIGLLILSIAANKKQLFSPSVIFAASFTFSAIWATAFAQDWNLKLEVATYYVICGGVLTFILIAKLTSYIFKSTNRQKYIVSDNVYRINNSKKMFLLSVVLLAFLGSMMHVVTHGLGSFSANISDINNMGTDLPMWLSLLRLAALWITNMAAYMIADTYVLKKKIDRFYLAIVLIGIITTASIGGRTQAFNTLFLMLCVIYVAYEKNSKKQKTINYRVIVKIALIFTALLYIFPRTLELMGRTSRVTDPLYYLAFYCGAEIKNLDIFISSGAIGGANSLFGEHTFSSLITWIGPYFGLDPQISIINNYQFINGLVLGNVYTTFYAYIYDFGYVGMIILVSLMAVISQFAYEKAIRERIDGRPQIWMIVYGYISSTLVLSFFSNKFYEQVFYVVFVRGVIVLLIVKFILCKVKFKWLFVHNYG